MKRGKPLERKTPLRRTSTLKRGGRLRPRSAKAEGWVAWQQQERAAVMDRAWRHVPGQGTGQWCELPGCPERATEWHHAFGRRGTKLPEPWASSRLLTCATCRGHHDQVHAGAKDRAGLTVRELVQRTALERLRRHLWAALPVGLLEAPTGGPPWVELNYLLTLARDMRVEPPGWPLTGPTGAATL